MRFILVEEHFEIQPSSLSPQILGSWPAPMEEKEEKLKHPIVFLV